MTSKSSPRQKTLTSIADNDSGNQTQRSQRQSVRQSVSRSYMEWPPLIFCTCRIVRSPSPLPLYNPSAVQSPPPAPSYFSGRGYTVLPACLPREVVIYGKWVRHVLWLAVGSRGVSVDPCVTESCARTCRRPNTWGILKPVIHRRSLALSSSTLRWAAVIPSPPPIWPDYSR